FQPYTAAVLVPQHDLSKLFRRKLLSFGSKHNTLIRSVYEACSAHTSRPSSRIEHFINRRSELQQPVRPDLDLKLANLSAENHNLRDTRHGQQTRPERPIREGPDFHQ